MKKANPKIIGTFVVGAVAILVVGLLVFGSGKVFEERIPIVMLFHESVAGLSIGSPITLNGAAIGEITKIRVEYNIDTVETRIPVFGELIPEKLSLTGAGKGNEEDRMAILFRKGLRAQLVPQSLVTGQLAVELSFHPESPMQLSEENYGISEIPTITSSLVKLRDELTKIRLSELVDSAIKLVNNLNAVVASPRFDELLSSLSSGSKSFDVAMTKVAEGSGPIVDNLRSASAELHETLVAARQTILTLKDNASDLDRNADETLAKIRVVLDNIDRQIIPLSQSIQYAARSVETTFDDVDSMLSADADVRRNLEASLRNIATAAEAIKELADELQQNPEALIRGRR